MGEMNSKEDLLKYAIEMRMRGDTFRSMLGYLEGNCDDRDVINEIITTVDELEKQGKFVPEESKKEGLPKRNLILGSLFVGGGTVLLVFLWGEGRVSFIPFFIIGVGFLGLTGAIK